MLRERSRLIAVIDGNLQGRTGGGYFRCVQMRRLMRRE